MFEEMFRAGGESSQQFEEAMKNLMGDESEFMQQLQRLAQAANSAGRDRHE